MRALHDRGVAHMLVTHVRSLGTLVDPAVARVSMEARTQFTEHAKIGFVCTFVSAVEHVVKIRTGSEGRDAWR